MVDVMKWGVLSLVATLIASAAWGATAGEKCEAAKLKIAGNYGLCRLKAEAKAVKTGHAADYSKCDASLTKAWSAAESKSGGQCPTAGDQAGQQSELTRNAGRTAWRLSGGPRFVDNRDGTITDNDTGLMWEKKVQYDFVDDPANVHDADRDYGWYGNCSLNGGKSCQPTAAAATLCVNNAEGGTTGCDECLAGEGTCSAPESIWTFAAALNSAQFAGYSDWRVPTRRELESILDLTDGTSPMVNVAFDGASCGTGCADIAAPACSCTADDGLHWTASINPTWSVADFMVWFYNGAVLAQGGGGAHVRAVRGER
jgi:hypothetical protein